MSGKVCKATGFLTAVNSHGTLNICEECACWLVQRPWKHNWYRMILYTTVTFVRIKFAKWCPHHGWYKDYRAHNYAAGNDCNDCSLSIRIHDLSLHLTDTSKPKSPYDAGGGKCKLRKRWVRDLTSNLHFSCSYFKFSSKISNFPFCRKAISKGLPVIRHVTAQQGNFPILILFVLTSRLYSTTAIPNWNSKRFAVINASGNIHPLKASKTTRS